MLKGKRLRYLIGADGPFPGKDDEVTAVPYRNAPAKAGVSIGYCNLFDEDGTGRFGPYLPQTDTAIQYRELVPDPKGPGFEKNLREQFARRKKQGFEYVELDNPDAFEVKDILRAIDLAETYSLRVIAKNAALLDDPLLYLGRCHAVIIEKGAGAPGEMNRMRRDVGQPNMPCWFVSFGSGAMWAQQVKLATMRADYRNMFVSFSRKGEYGSSDDV